MIPGLRPEAPHGHRHRGDKKDVDQHSLALRLAAADQRRQVNRRAHPGNGDPEDRQLQVPALGPTVGIHLADQFHVERAGMDGVVGQQSAVEDLHDEQQPGHEKELRTGRWLGVTGISSSRYAASTAFDSP